MAITVRSGVRLDRITRKLIDVLAYYPRKNQIYITSALRDTPDDYHGGLLRYGSSAGRAIDIGSGGVDEPAAGRDVAKWLYQFSAHTVELIHTTPFSDDQGFYVKNQRKNPGGSVYGPRVRDEHRDHTHWATTEELADRILAKLRASKPSPRPEVTPTKDRPVLRRGDSGPWVGFLQGRLRSQGHKIDVAAGLPFGPQTEAAVKDMQRKRRSAGGVDGIVGKETWDDVDYFALRTTPPEKRPVLRRGATGQWVGMVQAVLRRAGHKIDDPPGYPFGPQTERALKAFQAKHRTPGGPDGVVSCETWLDLDAFRDGILRLRPEPAPKPSPTPQPEPPAGWRLAIFGWDASNHDHRRGMRAVHIKAAAAEGIRFFTHKATEHPRDGALITHGALRAKITAARDAGIPFLGAYVVVRTGRAAGEQAEAFLEYVDDQVPWWREHPAWFWQIDVEKWPYDAVAPELGEHVAVEVEQLTGRRAMLYASHGQYGDSIPGDRPLWNADYRSSGAARPWRAQWLDVEIALKEYADQPWRSSAGNQGFHRYSRRVPAILQFASDATVGGQATCDVNVFRGSDADFAKMISAPS